MKYRPEIDGLRALAVIPVIFFHAGFSSFQGGFVGVDVFFVISGYLITTIIAKDLQAERFKVSEFYERRARRILPALLFVIFVCFPFAWYWLSPGDMVDFAQSLMAVATFSSNILFWQESGYFDAAAEMKPLLHTWSLAVEEQYYIIFPLFMMWMWRFGMRAIAISLILIFLASLSLGHWGALYKPYSSFYLLPTRGWEILLGALCSFVLMQYPQTEFVPNSVRNILAMAGIALIVGAVYLFDQTIPMPGLYALVPTGGAALLILFATRGTLAAKILSMRAFVGLGLISYSAYLWHQPLFAFARHAIEEPGVDLFAGLSALSIALAFISWKYVETPFRNRDLVSNSFICKASLVSLCALIILGGASYLNDGNYGRWSKTVVSLHKEKESWEDYVWKLKKQVRHKSFANDSSLKILVIGDSNSADLINALELVYPAASLSSLRIDAGCGNLFLPQDHIALMRQKAHAQCASADQLENTLSKSLIAQADIVVFASKWRMWEARLVEQSHRDIVKDYGNKFWYFGTKPTRFTFENALEIASRDGALVNILTSPTEEGEAINSILYKAIGGQFLNPYDLLCSEGGCPNVNNEGQFEMYDGFHLTSIGAQRLASAIKQKNPFKL